ncbi:integral membrane protein [Grosmannia clavigera kw1407]|uniref:Integral membrane protein n=1 Tax=Grosmannia clavigera (strain kw1407 / UAMH 11150) TaxID=655863 RepID=F0XBI4_GROCL|nr:uncharacterized protein CMQ_5327 [Grosmannia clavigera kw1407]EFX05065.1 integral membrane protein [Grosmannia clavigera kw1407]
MATTEQPGLGEPQFASHASAEPVSQGLLGRTDVVDLRDERDKDEDEDQLELSPVTTASTKYGPKKRNLCGVVVQTPNSSRYANYWHSRFIQKYPFLVEMFYWAVNLLLYVSIKSGSEYIFATDGVWKTAENHGIAVLDLEQRGIFRFLIPMREIDVQHFFRAGHQGALTVLNRAYSLIHIPVTVSFLGWYYYAAPSHAQFASVRRMMSLTNFFSFVTFMTYPCMPPRLLPEKYGFFDTVRREDAESIWATGKFFNQLAAFPSLHFGYSFCIGTVLLYHSGILRNCLAPREKRQFRPRQILLALLSVVYPGFVLLIIIATANHYWLDAMAATGVVAMSWLCNRVFLMFLPLEDIFLWCVKLEKPIPTTGYKGNAF